MAASVTSIAVRWLEACQRRKRLLRTLVLLMALAALWTTLRGHYTNDLAHAFPADSQAGKMYAVLQRSRLTQTIQLELTFDTPPPRAELTEGLLLLEEILKNMPRHIDDAIVHYNVQADALVSDIVRTLPLTQSPDILAKADAKQAANAIRKAMAMPGTPLADMRADPFGLRLPILQQLADFQAAAGFRADLTDGFIISPEGDRALVLIEPHFNGAPKAEDIVCCLMAVEDAAADIFPDARRLVVSPLRHNLENELAVRDGLLTATLVSAALLFLLFLVLYRRAWDALLLPCLPLLATLLVTGLMALLFKPLCLFVVGIGGGIAGLAIDQCIHVFAAHTGEKPLQKVASLLRPLLLSALTSAAVFLLVTTTGISAYRQLGLFAALILTVNLLLSLALLPGLLKRRNVLAFSLPAFRPGKRLAAAVSLVWLVLMILAACALPRLKTNFSMKAMDGTSAERLAEEETMMRRWRASDGSVMLVLDAPDEDTALARCEALAEAVRQEGLTAPFHPALLWPCCDTREANRTAWRQPKTRQRLDELQHDLQKELVACGLPPALCDNGFADLRKTIDADGCYGTMPEAIRGLTCAMLKPTPDGVAAFAFADESRPELLTAAARVPDTAVASADAFQEATWAAVRPRLRHLGYWLLPVLLLALFPLLRHPAQLLVVALPGATALMLGGALAVLCGYALNLVSLFSLAMLTGLVLDYGLFALHARKVPGSLPTAMLLSALTSIAATAALTTSRHPVMFHTGIVLSVGILLTALTALLVVPSLLQCAASLRTRKHAALSLLLLLAAISLLAGCQSSLPLPAQTSPLLSPPPLETAAFQRAFQAPQTRVYTMKTSFFWREFTMLLVIRNGEEGLQAIGTAPNGMTLLSVAWDGRQQARSHFADAIPAVARKHLFGTLAQDLAHIFLKAPPKTEETYGGAPPHLVQRRRGHFPGRQWQAVYDGWNPETQTYDTIIYRNFDTRTTFTLKARP